MNATFDQLYRQLGRATFGLLVATLSAYGVTLVCAVLGLANAVATFGGVAMSLAYVFVLLLGVFLIASIAAAVVLWMERRHQVKAGFGSA